MVSRYTGNYNTITFIIDLGADLAAAGNVDLEGDGGEDDSEVINDGGDW